MTIEIKRCPSCGEVGTFGGLRVLQHRCKPAWEWRTDEDHGPDEWRTIHAYTNEEAAVLAADRYDEEDRRLLSLEIALIVHVRNPSTGETSRFSVRGEAVPHYWASEERDDA